MMKKSASDFGKFHRFWIENGDIPGYRNADDDGKLTYEFYYTPMLVKKCLLKKNSHVSKNILLSNVFRNDENMHSFNRVN